MKVPTSIKPIHLRCPLRFYSNKRRNRFLIWAYRIVLLNFIVPTIFANVGFQNIRNTSILIQHHRQLDSWHRGKASLVGSWMTNFFCLQSPNNCCYSLHYVTHAQKFLMRLFTIVNTSNDNEETVNAQYRKFKSISNIRNNDANNRTLQIQDTNSQKYKGILDVLELFLCFLIAVCFELLPLAWQQLQRQQHISPTFRTSRMQPNLRTNHFFNDERSTPHCNNIETNLWVRLKLWCWLLASTNNRLKTTNRLNQNNTEKYLKKLFVIMLSMRPQERRQFLAKSEPVQQHAILFTIMAIEMSNRVLLTKNAIKSPCSIAFFGLKNVYCFFSPVKETTTTCKNKENLPDETLIIQNCPFKRNEKNQTGKNERRQATHQKPQPERLCYTSNKRVTSLLANEDSNPFYTNCCCSCRCCSCCWDCSCCWSCCICGLYCRYCYCVACSRSTVNNCQKYCHKASRRSSSMKTYADKCSSSREIHNESHCSVYFWKIFFRDIYQYFLKYIQNFCYRKLRIHQKQKRRIQQQQKLNITTKRNSFCNGHHTIDNCTSNYQQLKASNACKFFCNNRKRQRRRRRKRRRRHTLNSQDLQSSSRINVTVANNCRSVMNGRKKACDQHPQQLSFIKKFLRNAFKTITTFTKEPQNKRSRHQQTRQQTNLKRSYSLFVKYSHNSSTVVLGKTHSTTFRRVYIKGFKSRSNLVWLIIGLVWFESSRLVDCYLQRQKYLDRSNFLAVTSPSTTIMRDLSKPMLNKGNFFKNCVTEPQIKDTSTNFVVHPNRRQRSDRNQQELEHSKRTNTKIKLPSTSQYLKVYSNAFWHSAVKEKSLPENSLTNDRVRLESIKRQILSKLGLNGRPNISHPLPKQFVWDTIYRVGEIGAVIQNLDFVSTNAEKRDAVWSIMDNYDHSQRVQVRVYRNSTHAPHQSYKYSEQQTNSVPQQQIFKYTRDSSQNLRNRNNKLTYLSGITSGMEIPVTLVGDPKYLRGSPQYETETFGYTPNNNDIVSQHKHINSNAHGDFLDDNAAEDFFAKTEEIISFAEEGQSFSQHRLVEFSANSQDLTLNKLYVRKAEIHVKIDYLKNKNNKFSERNGGNLKIWIFRMVEGNITSKITEEKIHFCAAFEIDTEHMGWKKLDITETVRQWLSIPRWGTVSQKLRLLIDCTGCGEQYQLHLFGVGSHQTKQIKESKNSLKNDVVAIWLQHYIEKNSTVKEKRNNTTKYKLLENSGPPPTNQYPYRPFLVIRTELQRASRRVRRRVVDCSGALRGQCCKESFYVSFKALGWDDWIIAPRGYFANYCRGECTGAFRTPDTFQTFHAHFIEEYRKMGLLNGMKPCCAPIKFSSMSLIYYGDDGIIKRDLPKMVVDECGCP